MVLFYFFNDTKRRRKYSSASYTIQTYWVLNSLQRSQMPRRNSIRPHRRLIRYVLFLGLNRHYCVECDSVAGAV